MDYGPGAQRGEGGGTELGLNRLSGGDGSHGLKGAKALSKNLRKPKPQRWEETRGGESQGKRMFKTAAKEGQCPGVSVALVRALCGQGWAECGSQGFCAGTGDEDQGLKEAEARGSEAEGRDTSGGRLQGAGRLPAWSVHPDF